MKSSMAAPSFRNSGFETTSNSIVVAALASASSMTAARTLSAVPTGTVDFVDDDPVVVHVSPMLSATAST